MAKLITIQMLNPQFVFGLFGVESDDLLCDVCLGLVGIVQSLLLFHFALRTLPALIAVILERVHIEHLLPLLLVLLLVFPILEPIL